MRSTPGPLMTLGVAAVAGARLIVYVKIAAAKSSATPPR